MNNRFSIFLFLSLLLGISLISAGDSTHTRHAGLYFYGNHSKIHTDAGKQVRLTLAERTRFTISPKDFSASGEKYTLEFTFAVWYNKVFANFFEISNTGYQLSLRYLYHPDSLIVHLQLRVNNKHVLLSFPVPLDDFVEKNAFRFNLSVDETTGSVVASLNNSKKKATSKYIKPGANPKFDFGVSYRDADCMNILMRDLKLYTNNELLHHWKFAEVSGNIAYDSEGDLDIEVVNPGWQMNYYFNWQKAFLPNHSNLKNVTSFYRLNTNNRKAAIEEKPDNKLTGNLLPIEKENLQLKEVLLDTVYNRLYAVLQDVGNKGTNSHTFSLFVPAMSEVEYRMRLNLTPEAGRKQYPGWIAFTGAGIIAMLIPLFIIIRRYKQKRILEPGTSEAEVVYPPVETKITKDVITLFGGLKLIDGNGSEIQIELTPKLQEIFSAILYYTTFGNSSSVSIRKLEKIIWADIPKEKLKNNRNVAFSKLRKTLNKLQSVKLEVDDDIISLKVEAPLKNEMAELQTLLQLFEVKGKISIDSVMERFTDIIKGGTVLEGIKSDWAEKERFTLSNRIIEILLLRCAFQYDSKEFHGCNKTAGLVDLFDPANEEAFKFKMRSLFHLGRHSLVEEAWESFQKEYETVYGKKYPQTIQSILKN